MDMKVKIYVKIGDKEQEKELNIEQAIAYLQYQLESLKKLSEVKKQLSDEVQEQIQKDMIKKLLETQREKCDEIWPSTSTTTDGRGIVFRNTTDYKYPIDWGRTTIWMN